MLSSKKTKRPIKENQVYDNCNMLTPEGAHMAYVPFKRMQWYLDRNLAEKIDDTTFRLTFEPKGKGNYGDESHQSRENRCVICGTEEGLTLHHIVPRCYRKFFPLEYKDRNCFDVVCVCHECHDKYEQIATLKKNNMSRHYGVHPGMERTEEQIKAGNCLSLIGALLRHSERMPAERIAQIEQELSVLLEEDVSIEKIQSIADKHTERLKEVFGAVEDDHSERTLRAFLDDGHEIFDFIMFWREHFVENAKPKYLDEGWCNHYKTRER